MPDDSVHGSRQAILPQFSLATLLILVTLAALVAASISELPEWIGAPLLAFIATTAAAVVVGAAIRSRGYALTFYLGAAFPLCMLMVRTSLILGALSDGLMQRGDSIVLGGWMQPYSENFVGERHSYRWEVAAALASAPLIGLACVAFRWLGDQQRRALSKSEDRIDRRLLKTTLVVCLILLAGSVVAIVAIRSLPIILPLDPAWEGHDGSAVLPSGKLVQAASNLTAGDRVLVEQGGAWWRGRVKRVAADGNVAIHYVGWEASYDESVPVSRLQLP